MYYNIELTFAHCPTPTRHEAPAEALTTSRLGEKLSLRGVNPKKRVRPSNWFSVRLVGQTSGQLSLPVWRAKERGATC